MFRPSLNTLSYKVIIILVLCLSIMYLIIPVHAQYIIILVDVRFYICHSYLFFILLFSSVVLLLSLTLLFCMHLTQKVTGEFHWKHCQ